MATFLVADLDRLIREFVMANGKTKSTESLSWNSELKGHLCKAFSNAGIVPQRVIGAGVEKVVFDIGNGRVARLSEIKEHSSTPDFPAPQEVKPVDSVYFLEIQEHLPHKGTRDEKEFMVMRLKRNGFTWQDPKENNLARRANGEIVLFDRGLKRWEQTQNLVCVYALRDSRIPGAPSRDVLVAERWNGIDRTCSWLMWRPDKKAWVPAPGMHKFWDASSRWANRGVLSLEFGQKWKPGSSLDSDRTFSQSHLQNASGTRLPTAKEFDAAVPQVMSAPPSLNSGATL